MRLPLQIGLALAVFASAASAQAPVKIGVVGPKTGPLAAGAAVTHWPNFKLWAHQINARGGLRLKDGQRKIELIEYDDRTQPGETIKAVERLATQDKADFIMAPYGTGFNLATAPIFAKYGYPQIAQAAVTDKVAAQIGQRIVVDNRAGASGNIALELAARAAPVRSNGVSTLPGQIAFTRTPLGP